MKYTRMNGSDPFKDDIAAIKVISGCRTGGVGLAAGKTYKVPARVSLDDAKTLIAIGKAVPVSVRNTPKNKEDDLKDKTSNRSQKGE
ncbi:MAG: hypothetical protein ACE5GY_07095 [Thermodesulfobacteriota bacterium]